MTTKKEDISMPWLIVFALVLGAAVLLMLTALFQTGWNHGISNIANHYGAQDVNISFHEALGVVLAFGAVLSLGTKR